MFPSIHEICVSFYHFLVDLPRSISAIACLNVSSMHLGLVRLSLYLQSLLSIYFDTHSAISCLITNYGKINLMFCQLLSNVLTMDAFSEYDLTLTGDDN